MKWIFHTSWEDSFPCLCARFENLTFKSYLGVFIQPHLAPWNKYLASHVYTFQFSTPASQHCKYPGNCPWNYVKGQLHSDRDSVYWEPSATFFQVMEAESSFLEIGVTKGKVCLWERYPQTYFCPMQLLLRAVILLDASFSILCMCIVHALRYREPILYTVMRCWALTIH